MSVLNTLQEQFDQLKQMASKNLIPSYALYQKMEDLQNREKLETLKGMFSGADLGESIIVDVFGANKGNLPQSVNSLLEITEERRKIEEAEREALNQILKQREQEAQRLATNEKEQDQNNAMKEFVHIASSADMLSQEFETIPKEPSGENVDIADFVMQADSPALPRKDDIQPSTPPPSYYASVHPPPVQPSAPRLDDVVFLPPEDEPPSQNFGGFSENDLFASWNPAAAFDQSSLKRVLGHITPSRDIMSASITGTPAKGLKNGLGENNCFLNVVIQSLWHLKAFRTKFNNAQNHSHPTPVQEDACPFCALKLIFAQYQFGEEQELPPTLLRKAMSQLFKAQSRYQMGSFEDAAEAHDAILNSLHLCVTGGNEALNSFVHQVFSMHVIQYARCPCGQRITPSPSKEFIFYVSAKALKQQASLNLDISDEGKIHKGISFGKIINEVNHEDQRICPNQNCKKSNHLRFALANLPEVFTIGIVWDTATPTTDYIHEIMDTIDQQILVKEIFDSVVQPGSYTLRGMICYYGLHYNAYFRNPKTREWLMFDDSRVTKVGSSWDDVTKKCCAGKWQPFVLWYEATPIHL